MSSEEIIQITIISPNVSPNTAPNTSPNAESPTDVGQKEQRPKRNIITSKEYRILWEERQQIAKKFDERFEHSASLYFSDLIRDALKKGKEKLETPLEKIMKDEILKSMDLDDIPKIDPLPKESELFDSMWDVFRKIVDVLPFKQLPKPEYESAQRKYYVAYLSEPDCDTDTDTGSDSCSDSDSDSD